MFLQGSAILRLYLITYSLAELAQLPGKCRVFSEKISTHAIKTRLKPFTQMQIEMYNKNNVNKAKQHGQEEFTVK